MNICTKLIIGISLVAALACSNNEDSSFQISPLFSNNMVVQRDTTVILWGTGISGKNIHVKVDGKNYETQVANDKSWEIALPAFELHRNYTIYLSCGNKHMQLDSVVAGDVWLCGGQSNMELPVSHFPWCKQEVDSATNKNIRFYSVPDCIDLIPAQDIPTGEHWHYATGEDLKNCSATAYCYAKALQPELGVPIGLLSSNWSGTSIEPWLPRSVIAKLPQYKKEWNELNANTKSKKQIDDEFVALRKTWDKDYYLKGIGMDQKWYLPNTNDSDWKPTKLTTGYWEDSKVGLDSFDGAVWYRTRFNLDKDHKKGDAYHLYLGAVRDYNTTWVNGKIVGETFGSENWSDYWVPDSLLNDTNNVVVVRVYNVEGKGGFHFHPLWGTPLLNGQWYCKAGAPMDKKTFIIPHVVNVNPYSYPTIEYNAMIAPLSKLPIKGIIWYQGESNGGRGYEYRTLFPEMITAWRTAFGNSKLPFYFVQLASYGTPNSSGNNSDWAELRESQTYALKLPETAMITAIDIGDSADIHPKNKQEVGRRLSLLALEHCYHNIKGYDYPQITNVSFNKQETVVRIKSSSEMVFPSGTILGFSLAGKDEKFYPAVGTYIDGHLVVKSKHVTHPVALRYAWGKNPGTLNLYNKNLLPLLPYRTDTWKGITDDRIYNPNIVYF